jgi:hypothetical protein
VRAIGLAPARSPGDSGATFDSFPARSLTVAGVSKLVEFIKALVPRAP